MQWRRVKRRVKGDRLSHWGFSGRCRSRYKRALAARRTWLWNKLQSSYRGLTGAQLLRSANRSDIIKDKYGKASVFGENRDEQREAKQANTSRQVAAGRAWPRKSTYPHG